MRSGIVFMAFVVFAMTIGGCSILQKQLCTSTRAYEAGKTDAAAWSAEQKGMQGAQMCDGAEYSISAFKHDYTMGYSETLKAQCDSSAIQALADQDVQNGKSDRLAASPFALCQHADRNPQTITALYKAGFEKSYCIEARLQTQAQKLATDFAAPDYAWEKTCVKNKKNLRTAYNNAYQETMKEKCSEVNVAKLAVQDADARLPLSQGLDRISRCPSVLQGNALRQYQNSYGARSQTLQQQQNVQALQKQLAPSGFASIAKGSVPLGRPAGLSEKEIAKVRASRFDFAVNGQTLYTTCRVMPDGQKAEVSVSNLGNQPVSITQNWDVDMFDPFGRIMKRNNAAMSVWVESQMTSKLEVPTQIVGVDSCKAVVQF